MRPEEDIFDKKPQWNGSRSDYGNPESKKWQQYGQDYAQWRQDLDREEFGKYGSAVNARTAYSMGNTDMEAVRGAAVTMGAPSVITGRATQVLNNDGSSFNSTFTHHFDNGNTRTTTGGHDNSGNEWDYTTVNLGGGVYSYGSDDRRGSNDFETYTPNQIDYGKKLGMNTVTAPKPIAPIK